MFGQKSPDVLIVGAGPVGMFAALLLARKGIHVKIVDKEEREAGHSYALGLHPASLKLFEEVGLLNDILDNSYRVRTVGLYDKQNRRSELHLSQLEEDFSFLAITPQNRYESILEEALNKSGVQIMWSHQLAVMEPKASHVSVKIDRLEKETLGYAVAHTEWVIGKTITMDVPFVIGADGYSSTTRRLSQIDFDLVGDPQNFAVYEFKTDVDLHHESSVVMDEESTNVLWPLGNNRCRWSFQLTDAPTFERSREKERIEIYLGSGRYPWLSGDYLHTLIEGRAPWFQENIEQIDWGAVVRFERRLANSFGRERVWLAGDSAHLTGPVGVQSMNAGLREAFDLATRIAGILGGGGSQDSLADYNEERMNEWKTLHGLQGGLRPGSDTDPWIAQYADRLLSCMPATGADLTLLARQLNLELVGG